MRAMNRLALVGVVAVMALDSRPALAQADISGEWRLLAHEDTTAHNVDLPGQYLGLPLTDAGRLRADTWNQSIQTLPEHQCYPHPLQYGEHDVAAISVMRIFKTVDPATQQVIAYHKRGNWMEPERTIWMDGRPHPPEYAAHTFQGFSTGKWEGAMLTVIATHLKDGYVALNGVGSSDVSTVIEHFVRHGDYLTQVTLVIDPVYLAEPFIKTSTFVLDPKIVLPRYPCGPNEVVVEIPRPRGQVPHWLPGANHFLSEFAIREGLPYDAVRGYDESLYPEYMEKLKAMKPATATNAAAAK